MKKNMQKKAAILMIISVLALVITACGKENRNAGSGRSDQAVRQSQNDTEGQASQSQNNENPEPADTQANQEGNSNILIAYFSRVGNTDFPEDVDAVSSASLLKKDGELYGNTQYLATLIQENTGGDLFLIETEEKYPADYDETDEQGRVENRERTRPKLASRIENPDDYEIIFLGFPDWYYDMPMAVYTFLEENDFSGKTIVPFVTSGGSGFSDTLSEIEDLQPDAQVLTDGFEATHSRVSDVSSEDVKEWIDELSLN